MNHESHVSVSIPVRRRKAQSWATTSAMHTAQQARRASRGSASQRTGRIQGCVCVENMMARC